MPNAFSSIANSYMTLLWSLFSITKVEDTDRPGYSRKSHCTIAVETNALKKPVTYTEIIQRLVSRFIHEQKKTMKMDGVNEDELKEIKQDISSLRFELRDGINMPITYQK
uniref:COMM domain-containing protein n=1 Tax=Meloidogyne hapla TaxID=6305 RepID=A0A1I8BA22_MELHA